MIKILNLINNSLSSSSARAMLVKSMKISPAALPREGSSLIFTKYILYKLINNIKLYKKLKENYLFKNYKLLNRFIYRINKSTAYSSQFYYTPINYKKRLNYDILTYNLLKHSFSLKLRALFSNPKISHSLTNVNILLYTYYLLIFSRYNINCFSHSHIIAKHFFSTDSIN